LLLCGRALALSHVVVRVEGFDGLHGVVAFGCHPELLGHLQFGGGERRGWRLACPVASVDLRRLRRRLAFQDRLGFEERRKLLVEVGRFAFVVVLDRAAVE